MVLIGFIIMVVVIFLISAPFALHVAEDGIDFIFAFAFCFIVLLLLFTPVLSYFCEKFQWL